MTAYLFRLDNDLHVSAQRRAASEGRTLRWVLERALADWLSGAWTPTASVVPAPAIPRPSTTSRGAVRRVPRKSAKSRAR